MPGTSTERGKLRWRVMPALIVAASLGVMAPASAAVRTQGLGGRPAIAYVLNGNGYLTPINTKTDVAWKPIQLGSSRSAMATTPNGKTITSPYRRRRPSQHRHRQGGGAHPHRRHSRARRAAPDGQVVYVASVTADTITPINTATNTAGRPITTGGIPRAIVFTPDSKTTSRCHRNLHDPGQHRHGHTRDTDPRRRR